MVLGDSCAMLEQQRDQVSVAVRDRLMHRRVRECVEHVGVSAQNQELLDDTRVAEADGEMESALPIVVLGIDVGAELHQRRQESLVALAHRPVQHRVALLVARIDPRAVEDEALDDRHVAALHSEVQRRGAVGRRGVVATRTGLQERSHQRIVAEASSEVERRLAVKVGGAHRGAVLEERHRLLDEAVRNGKQQRSVAVAITRLDHHHVGWWLARRSKNKTRWSTKHSHIVECGVCVCVRKKVRVKEEHRSCFNPLTRTNEFEMNERTRCETTRRTGTTEQQRDSEVDDG